MSMQDCLDYCIGVLAAEPDQDLVRDLLALGRLQKFNFRVRVPRSLELLLGLDGDGGIAAGAGQIEGDEDATVGSGAMQDGDKEGAEPETAASSGEDAAGTSAAAANNADGGSAAEAAEIEADYVPETVGSDSEGSSDADAETPPAPRVLVLETPPLPQEGDELGVPCSLGGRGADEAGETSDTRAGAEIEMAAPTAPAQAPAPAAPAASAPAQAPSPAPRLPAGRDEETWCGLVPLNLGERSRNVRPRPPVKPPARLPNSVTSQMAAAACKATGQKCQRCNKHLEMVNGKVLRAHCDHVHPLAWGLTCPAVAAANLADRLEMARDVTVFQMLCPECHANKTTEDATEAARAAATTLFMLLDIPAAPAWSPDALEQHLSPQDIQAVLKAKFEAGLIAAKETLRIYQIGPNGMPMCRCRKCSNLVEVSQYSWSQDFRDAQIARIERSVMLKPHCPRPCKGSTVPVVCKETDRPHFNTDSAAKQLAELRRSKVGWLVPEDDAKVAKWRQMIENGKLWFRP